MFQAQPPLTFNPCNNLCDVIIMYVSWWRNESIKNTSGLVRHDWGLNPGSVEARQEGLNDTVFCDLHVMSRGSREHM